MIYLAYFVNLLLTSSILNGGLNPNRLNTSGRLYSQSWLTVIQY